MKEFCSLLFSLSLITALQAQTPNPAERLPESPDMPAWAKLLYRTDISVDVAEIDEAFEDWEKAREAAEGKDDDGDGEYEENVWEEYYHRWRYGYLMGTPANDAFAKQGNLQGSNGGNWTLLGPVRTFWAYNQSPSLQLPPAPWQVNVYAIDVAPSNPSILYCGTETGAVNKTTDKGLHWTLVGQDYFTGSIGAVAIHPDDPNTVYAGNNAGVHRSTDGGLTWAPDLAAGSFGANDIKIKPDEPEIVLAGGASLRRRSAAGVWTTVLNKRCYDIDFQPGNPAVVYALVENAALNLCEFWKSIDGGQSFTLRSNGWISGLGNGGGRLTVTPADPNRVYVVVLTGSGPRILRSDNTGESWTVTASGSTGALAMDNGQGFFDLSITASHSNANHLVVATTTAYKSTDGGYTYSTLGGYSGPFGIHPDIQEMKTLGGDSWIATDGGISLSTDFWTATSNFSPRIEGLAGSHFWGFDCGWNEDVMVGGRYHNGNTAWHENYPAGQYLRMGGGEAATGYVNPGNNRMVYFSDIGGRILPEVINKPYSTFGVSRWPNESYFNMEWSEPVWDPRCFTTFYIGDDNSLWKTTDNGASFAALFTDSDATARVQHIAVSRTDPNTIYCTVQRGSSGDLYKSTDGGANWTACGVPTGLTANQRRISTVAVSGTDPNTLWWAFRTGPNGSKIFRSTDGGATWINLSTPALNGVNIADMVHQLGTDGGIYLAGSFGRVFYRNNSMPDWEAYDTGLPAALSSEITRIKIFYKGKKLRLAANMGIWETDLLEPSAQTLPQPMAERINPLCGRDTIRFESYSVVNGPASYQWSFTPAPQWVSSANVRNPQVVFGAPGNYSATLTVTDDNGTTSRSIDGFIQLPPGSDCRPDSLPGDALRLQAPGDYALAPPLGISTNTLTLSAWIRPDGPQDPYTGLVFSASGNACGLNLRDGNQLGYHWNGNAGTYNWAGGPIVPADQWSHVALVITPSSATVYLNGVPYTRTATHPVVSLLEDFRIGRDRGYDTRNFRGLIDEVCIYQRALTRDEIRELMHLTRDPATDPDLLAYYQFNAGGAESGTAVIDRAGFNHAALVGSADRVKSTAPVGSGVSVRATVSGPGAVSFGTTGLALDFPASGTYPDGELCVSRLDPDPDQLPNGSPHSRGYWILNNYGNNPAFSAPASLVFGEYGQIPAGSAAGGYRLYLRSTVDEGNTWTGIATAASVQAGGQGSVVFSDDNFVESPAQMLVVHEVQGAELSGFIRWASDPGQGVEHVLVQLNGDYSADVLTSADGSYLLSAPAPGDFVLTPEKVTGLGNGLNVADALTIQRHVAAVAPLADPYRQVAADVNRDDEISVLDALLIQQWLLDNPAALGPFDKSWRFVPQTYPLSLPPWGFPESLSLPGAGGALLNQDFYGIKVGDVAAPFADPNQFAGGSADTLWWRVEDRPLATAGPLTVTFTTGAFTSLAAYQFALHFDTGKLSLDSVEILSALPLTAANFGLFNLAAGEIRSVWSTASAGYTLSPGAEVFRLHFQVSQPGGLLSEALALDTAVLPGVAYNVMLEEAALALEYFTVTGVQDPGSLAGLQLFQNRPNPFRGGTAIGFTLPRAGAALLRVLDVNGRELWRVAGDYPAGYSEAWMELRGAPGVLFCELVTPFGVLRRKMAGG